MSERPVPALDLLRTAIELFPEGIVVVERVGPGDLDFDFFLVNEAFERMAAVDRADVLGSKVADHFPTLASTGYFEHCAHALETGERQVPEPVLYDEHPVRVWTQTTYTPLDDRHVMVVGLDVTDTMDTLERQEVVLERLHRAERLAMVGSWEWRFAGDELQWSPEVYRIYGFDPADPPDYEVERRRIHPDDRATHDAIVQGWIAGGTGGEYAYRAVVDGAVRHLRGIAEAVEEDGELVGFAGAIHDVTELTHANAARTEAEFQFALLYESSPIGVMLIAPDGTITDVNPALMATFGLPEASRDHLVGRNLFDDEQVLDEGHRWYLERALSGEAVDVPAHRRDLSETLPADALSPDIDHSRWIEITLFPFGEGAAAFVSDVTLRHLGREQLKRASAIIDSMSNGLVVTDTEGTIVDVNPAFTEITGYSRREVLGQNPRILKSGLHDHRFYERMWREILEQGEWSGELSNRRKDGTTYRERLTITALHDHESWEPSGYVGVFSPIG